MQELYYETALNEIKNGKKETHWIWYIFPQLKGLGTSAMSEYHGIENIEEAREYLKHNLLRKNLLEICEILLQLNSNDILNIMEYPDNLKLQSSMTLFKEAEPNLQIFEMILKKYYNGSLDLQTIKILKAQEKMNGIEN